MSRFNGYKTYIVAVLIALASALHYLGYVDTEAYALILGVLGAGSIGTIRHAIKTEGGTK